MEGKQYIWDLSYVRDDEGTSPDAPLRAVLTRDAARRVGIRNVEQGHTPNFARGSLVRKLTVGNATSTPNAGPVWEVRQDARDEDGQDFRPPTSVGCTGHGTFPLCLKSMCTMHQSPPPTLASSCLPLD